MYLLDKYSIIERERKIGGIYHGLYEINRKKT